MINKNNNKFNIEHNLFNNNNDGILETGISYIDDEEDYALKLAKISSLDSVGAIPKQIVDIIEPMIPDHVYNDSFNNDPIDPFNNDPFDPFKNNW